MHFITFLSCFNRILRALLYPMVKIVNLYLWSLQYSLSLQLVCTCKTNVMPCHNNKPYLFKDTVRPVENVIKCWFIEIGRAHV